LILLDIPAPELDAFEICRRLRSIYALKHIPAAFLTARNSANYVRAGMLAGGDDSILKPFDPN
jgi:DNA-binding response OmpR family regulator